MQRDLHLQLFLFDFAIFLSIFLVDELDGEDGIMMLLWRSLLDTGSLSALMC